MASRLDARKSKKVKPAFQTIHFRLKITYYIEEPSSKKL